MARCPAAWTASVWKGTFRARQIAPISPMGWMVPISLLAYMTVTRQVSWVMAASTCWGVMRPSAWTSSRVTVKPSFSSFWRVCRTAWCSKAVEMIWVFPCRFPQRAAERMAWLSASLPPEVKTISSGRQWRQRATVSLAWARAVAAVCPRVYREEGFPYCSVR